jgi:hypothetical protein
MNDLISASSLLIAIAAMLFSLWYVEITKALEIVPKAYKEDNVAAYKTVSGVLHAKAMPVAVMATAVALIFFPDTARLIKESLRAYQESSIAAFERYDAVKTAYCFVTIFAMALAAYMWLLVAKLCLLRRRLRK